MRHRRRTSTRSMTIKKSVRSKKSPFPKKSNTLAGIFKLVASLIVIAGLLYVSYNYVWPLVKEKLPAFDELTSKKSSVPTRVDSKPQLPAENQTVSEANNPPPGEPQTFLPDIQVEILNGCGQQGIAKTLAEKLMSLKYDVVNTGNYLRKGKPFFEVKKTRIINQVDSDKTRAKAKTLARQIGLPEESVESIPNPNPIADITIIIGQDFNSLKIFKGKAE